MVKELPFQVDKEQSLEYFVTPFISGVDLSAE